MPGGALPGGAPSGGTAVDGGAGASEAGGTATGGAAGGAEAGGADTGGMSTGGAAGGAETGGRATGGVTTGGTPSNAGAGGAAGAAGMVPVAGAGGQGPRGGAGGAPPAVRYAEDDLLSGSADATVMGNVLDDNGNGPDAAPPRGSFTVTAVNGDTAAVGVPFTLPSGASVTVNGDGSLLYDPQDAYLSLDTGEIDTDTFTYQITSSATRPVTDEGLVTVTLTGVNDPPVAIDDAARVTGTSVIEALANDFDPENDPVVLLGAWDTGVGHAQALADGTIWYEPGLAGEVVSYVVGDTLAAPGFNVATHHYGFIDVPFNFDKADEIIAGAYGFATGFPITSRLAFVDLVDPDDGATLDFLNDLTAPGLDGGNDERQFVVVVTGTLTVTTDDFYQLRFAGGSAQGRLRVDLDGGGTFSNDEELVLRGGATPEHGLRRGQYDFELTVRHGSGAFGAELAYANRTTGTFVLVGDGSQGITSNNLRATTYDPFSRGNINSRSVAEALIADGPSVVTSTTAPVLNHSEAIATTRPQGDYPDDLDIPGIPGDSAVHFQTNDQYAVEATAYVYVPVAGRYTIGANFVGSIGITVTGAQYVSGTGTSGTQGGINSPGGDTFGYQPLADPGTVLGVFDFPSAGSYPLRVVFGSQSGDGNLELFSAQGEHTAFDAAEFGLIGNGGLVVFQTDPTFLGGTSVGLVDITLGT